MNKKIPSHLRSRKRYAIVGDGECEIWYFQMLKKHHPNLPINIEPKLAQKTTLQNQYKKIKEFVDSYDKVFWIIDYDVILTQSTQCRKGEKPRSQEFKEYYESLIKKFSDKISIIVNNPCLELWFIFHYKKSSKPFSNCLQAENDLKKIKILKDFEKTKPFFIEGVDIFKLTKGELQTAIENSKKLGEFEFENPSKSICEMWKFFEDENIKTYLL